MKLKAGDKIVFKKNVKMMLNGEDQTDVVGKVHTLLDGFDILIAEFSGTLLKVPIDDIEPYTPSKEEPARPVPDNRITITGTEFWQAVLTVGNSDYIKSHVENAEECKEIDFGIVASSGVIVANLLWEYLLNRVKS